MDLNAISKENKEYLAMNVGTMYRDSTRLAYEGNFQRVEETNGLYVCLEMKKKIDDILMGMRLEYAFIIRKEFLENKQGNWYLDYFSEEEYQLYKKAAIDEFLRCLYG